MRTPFLILAGLILSVSPVLAQQAPNVAEAFANEWSALDSSLNAASVQRQHVIEKARTLVQEWGQRGAELDYWHQWIAGEKSGWPQ